jgi:hypothetical protein
MIKRNVLYIFSLSILLPVWVWFLLMVPVSIVIVIGSLVWIGIGFSVPYYVIYGLGGKEKKMTQNQDSLT